MGIGNAGMLSVTIRTLQAATAVAASPEPDAKDAYNNGGDLVSRCSSTGGGYFWDMSPNGKAAGLAPSVL